MPAGARTARERRRHRRAEQVAPREAGRGPEPSGWVIPALGAVFLLSGAAGLVHEVVWARLLGHLFGATSLAVSTVLAAFMGGLALGSHLVGSRAARLGDRPRVYALLEIGIGVSALVIPLLLTFVQPLYGALWRRFHFSFAVFSILRFVVAGGILLPPTVMMGATLPLLADYVATVRGARVAPAWLYTANLAGAVLGVAAGGFVLMPVLGLHGTILAAAALNVTIGGAVLCLPRLASEVAPRVDRPFGSTYRPSGLLLAAAIGSGFMSLATQVAWTRVLVLIVGSTTYAFSTVLVAYLAALGAGSAWASRRGARAADVRPALAVVHLVMALGVLAAVYAVSRLPFWYVALFQVWRPSSIAATVVLNVAVVLALLAVPVLAAGTVLPLVLIGAAPPDAHDTVRIVGRLYAVNTVGAIVGAVLAGFVLVPRLGSHTTLLGIAALAAAIGVVFAFAVGGKRLPSAALAVATAVGVGVVAGPAWEPRALNAGVSQPHLETVEGMLAESRAQILYHREGPTATVAVAQWTQGGRRSLSINGRVNASDRRDDMMTQVLVAEAPLLIAPRVDDVLLVGWGSGVSAGTALAAPVRQVTAVEIEPAVVEASAFFAHVNHDPRSDPRLRLYEDDARHILLASDDTYDVIVSEPSHPWVSGVSNLFTQDFFRLAARRLRPDGVFSQWLQTYQMSFDTYRSLLATFQSVFPEVLVFGSPFALDCILVGSRQPLRLDLADLDHRWAHAPTQAELGRIGLTRSEHFLATFYLGPDAVRRLVHGAPINTDDNMLVEFSMPRDIVRRLAETSRETFAVLEQAATPVDEVLVDASPFIETPERAEALVDGLIRVGRDPEAYARVLERRRE